MTQRVRALGALVIAAVAVGAAAATPEEIAKQVAGAIKHEPTWQEITVRTAPSGVIVTLVYKPQPTDPSRATVERDTTTIARALLKAQIAAGQKPDVWVSASMPGGQGETGKPLVRPYGHTRYNPMTDQFEFERFTMP